MRTDCQTDTVSLITKNPQTCNEHLRHGSINFGYVHLNILDCVPQNVCNYEVTDTLTIRCADISVLSSCGTTENLATGFAMHYTTSKYFCAGSKGAGQLSGPGHLDARQLPEGHPVGSKRHQLPQTIRHTIHSCDMLRDMAWASNKTSWRRKMVDDTNSLIAGRTSDSKETFKCTELDDRH